MKIGKYIFSENSTNYINDENNFDLMSIVGFMIELILTMILIYLVVGMVAILKGCI